MLSLRNARKNKLVNSNSTKELLWTCGKYPKNYNYSDSFLINSFKRFLKELIIIPILTLVYNYLNIIKDRNKTNNLSNLFVCAKRNIRKYAKWRNNKGQELLMKKKNKQRLEREKQKSIWINNNSSKLSDKHVKKSM